MAKDFYQVLGISRDADEKAIKSAYRKLARKFHPDVNPNNPDAEAKFKEISSAHEVLADPDKRKLYDQFGENFDKIPPGYEGYAGQGGGFPGQGYGGGMPGGINLEDLLQQAQRGSGGSRVDFGGGAQGGGVGNLFGELFGGRGGAKARGPQKGGDVEHPIEITFVESVKGTQRRLNLKLQGDDGREETRDVTVKIPALINDGATVKVAGRGASSRGGGPNGDLFLRVRVAPDPFWKRDGLNIRVEVPVAFCEAALGATIKVPTVNGEVNLKLPAGTQGGQTFRLSGRGLKNETTGQSGDQYVSVQIAVPKNLSNREEELVKELATQRSEDVRAKLPQGI
jgi:curved DNA-binding protein